MRIRLLASVAAALALAGCQTDGAGSSPVVATPAAWSVPAAASLAFRCPSAGTRVDIGNGFLAFSGADPADPLVCLATNSTGQQQRRLYNFWILPLEDEASIRRGFGSLWPLAPGRTASYTFIGRSGDQNTFRYAENWRVLRTETLNIGGQPRSTVVMQRTQEGMLGNSFLGTDTYWYDTGIGAFIKREISVTRGRSGGAPFEARSITAPAGS
jgi:hypothetical protein